MKIVRGLVIRKEWHSERERSAGEIPIGHGAGDPDGTLRSAIFIGAGFEEGDRVALVLDEPPRAEIDSNEKIALCARCAERMAQANAEGKVGITICESCSQALAAVASPETRSLIGEGPAMFVPGQSLEEVRDLLQHPTPWRWDGLGTPKAPSLLVDANGNVLLGVDCADYRGADSIEPADDYVSEVTALAPELERDQRWLIGLLDDLDLVDDLDSFDRMRVTQCRRRIERLAAARKAAG